MTYFIYISLAVFVIQFFLFRWLSIYKLNLKTSLYDYAKWIKTKPKVLIMGSSHARGQISPLEISKNSKKYAYEDIYNVGADAACPFSMYITYKKNVDKFKNLELVYYTLDPHMLGQKYYLYTKFEKIFLNFTQWRYFTKHHKSYLKKHHQENNKFFFPIAIFLKSLEFNRQIFSGRNNGFSPLPHIKYNPYKENVVSKYIYEPLDIFPVSDFQILHLKKLKNEIENKGGKFILVLTPSYSWSNFYKKEAIEYDKQLVEKLNNYLGKATIIGSLFGKDFNLEYQDYKDDTHLAESGAIKFTNLLFKNIDIHKKNLKDDDVKSIYLYRFDKYNS